MLGTPNLGVDLASVVGPLCPWYSYLNPKGAVLCAALALAAHHFGIDLHSRAVKDMSPGSDVLRDLNQDLVTNGHTVYRAHAGRADTSNGFLSSSDFNNDCLVGEQSVDGPAPAGQQGAFAATRREYKEPEALSHTDEPSLGCNEPTLTDDDTVTENIAMDIKQFPAGNGSPGFDAPAVNATEPMGSDSAPLLTVQQGFVLQGAANTHTVTVEPASGPVAFSAFWLDSDVPVSLTIALTRPDGTTVQPGDPGVAPINLSGGDPFFVRASGSLISAPTAGTWTLSVTGAITPQEGTAYIAEAKPDSQTAAALHIGQRLIPEGTTQTITAELDDSGTAVAPTSLAASVLVLDGSAQPVTLHDDGLNGDTTAGDHVFTGSIDTTGGCGTYRVQVTASGSTSEGNVTREQLDTYDVSVPGDAVRDPCNPDEDADGLTDAAELNTYHTDALSPDTDGDGLTDGAEVNTYHTNPLVADTDGDGLTTAPK